MLRSVLGLRHFDGLNSDIAAVQAALDQLAATVALKASAADVTVLSSAVNNGTTGLVATKTIADTAEFRTRWAHGVRHSDCQSYPTIGLDTVGVVLASARSHGTRCVETVGASRTKIRFSQRAAATGMTNAVGAVWTLQGNAWTLARVTADWTATQAGAVIHSLTLLDPITLQPSPLVLARGDRVYAGIHGLWTTLNMAGKTITGPTLAGPTQGDYLNLNATSATAAPANVISFGSSTLQTHMWVALE